MNWLTAVLFVALFQNSFTAESRFWDWRRPRQQKSAESRVSFPPANSRLPSWNRRHQILPPILSMLEEIAEEASQEILSVRPETTKSLDAIFFSNEIPDQERSNPFRRRIDGPSGLPYNRTADCLENNICDPTVAYPENKIQKALKGSSKTTRRLINSLATPLPPPGAGRTSDADLSPVISIRLGGDHFGEDNIVLEENVCQTERKRIMPKVARNINDEPMWILNEQKGDNENYMQVVDITLCRDAGRSCLSGQIAGHKTRCKQEYTEHKLLALDKDGEELIIDTFRFPSCCTCQVNREIEL